MDQFEQEYIEKLRRHASDTRKMLSNAQKSERERMVVRAFLRCLGVDFEDSEIQTGSDEPIDVSFRSCQFQIKEVLCGRKRGVDWIERQKRNENAECITDLMEPYSPSEAMSYGEAANLVADELEQHASHYGESTCADLDVLVYLDIRGRHLWPHEINLDEAVSRQLTGQNWRSVSMLFVPYGAVIVSTPKAPDFLKKKQGVILSNWPEPDGHFEV